VCDNLVLTCGLIIMTFHFCIYLYIYFASVLYLKSFLSARCVWQLSHTCSSYVFHPVVFKTSLYTIFHCFCRYFHHLEASDVSFTHYIYYIFLGYPTGIYIYISGAYDNSFIIYRSLFNLHVGLSALSVWRFHFPKEEKFLFSGCNILYYLFSGRSSTLP